MFTDPRRWLFTILLLTLPIGAAVPQQDHLTPLIASPLTAATPPFLGTDGKQHVVYELVLTNANPTPATLRKIEVLDAAGKSRVLAVYDGKDLLTRLRTTGNTAAENAVIEFNGTRLFLIDLTLDSTAAIPSRVEHRISLLGASSPSHQPSTPVPLSYTVAPFALLPTLPEIGPPLAGKGWIVVNGCCGALGVHRSSGLPVNGSIYFAQRFAIDWMRIGADGRVVHGDPSNVRSYVDYGADVLAVADGKVVSTLNSLDDQKPGTLPDPKTMNIENVDGNHVVLDLGKGVFAFYAHMQKGSVTVAPGALVKRGQVLGKLGNTGNTSAPHLHFHLMDGPSVLGSNGIPYIIDSFAMAGRISEDRFAAATSFEGSWGEGLLPNPKPHRRQLPMDLSIVNFRP